MSAFPRAARYVRPLERRRPNNNLPWQDAEKIYHIEPSATCCGNGFPKICVKHGPSSRVSEPLHFPLWPRQVVIRPNLPY